MPSADSDDLLGENGPRPGEGPRRPPRPATLDIDKEETALSEAQRAALLSDKRVGAATRDPALQAVIRRIDAARDPAEALSREMHDPDFETFVDVLLSAIGASGDLGQERQEKMRAAKAELQRLLAAPDVGEM